MPDGEDKLVRSARRKFHQRPHERPKKQSSLRRYRAVFIELVKSKGRLKTGTSSHVWVMRSKADNLDFMSSPQFEMFKMWILSPTMRVFLEKCGFQRLDSCARLPN